MASPNPKSPGHTDKTKKYDRQLRLWGDHGQSALEAANVCLVNATATGTETLKSLILPGIGSFTIVDGSTVTGEDAGNNFFVDSSKIGKSRAQVATQLLGELNPDVRGDFVEENVDNLIVNNPSFFAAFTVVIATGLTEKSLHNLSQHLWKLQVPLLVCRSYGFVGYIRLQLKEHCIVESHPDNELHDLRLDKPFKGLVDYMNAVDFGKMDHKEFSHTPYLVLLFKALDLWKARYKTPMPANYKEKELFKNIIKEELWRPTPNDNETVIGDEENVQEAVKAVNTAATETKIPAPVHQILQDDACIHLKDKQPFWILARAVKDFVSREGEGVLPLRGSLPDMTSDSQRYIALQNIYREQAAKDADIVYRNVQSILHEYGWPRDLVTENDVRLFCRHAAELRLIRGRSVAEELDLKQWPGIHEVGQQLEDADSPWVHYLLLRAVDRFHTEYGYYPGVYQDSVETDIPKLKGCLSRLLSEVGCQASSISKDDNVHEMCRYGAAEIHSVASFIGGCAAHEVIKLVTRQYVPLDNTFIYNAITSTTATLRL